MDRAVVGITVILVLALLSQKPLGSPAPAPFPVPLDLVARHNAERSKHGLAPYQADTRLMKAAQQHANFMAAKGRMAHMGIGDGTPFERIQRAGYEYTSAAENVAWNQRDAATVMADWMSSPGHRAAILGSYQDMGAGVAAGKDGSLYWCTTFGASRTTRAIGEPWHESRDVD